MKNGNPAPNQTPNQQIQREESFVQREQSVFVPAPRALLRPLIRANRAIRENDIPQAVALLGEVLNDSITEDYLVPLQSPEGVSVSLRMKAQSILGSLPASDRQLYRLRYSVQAQQMLEIAIQQSDFEMVSQVMQRFFYTPAGFDAAMLLGHYHLDQGRPIAAASCFQRIVDSDEARAVHDPAASVLLATCWMLGDSPERAIESLVGLRGRSNKDTIEFHGKPVRLFDRRDQAKSWLLNLIGDSPLRNIAAVNQWVMIGGNPQRNARSGSGLPLLNPRWVTPTINDPDIENLVLERQRELILLDSAPVPSVQPLAIGNTIVMRAFDRMIGVDFATGKRVWVFPPWEFTDRFDRRADRLALRQIDKKPLTERMWLDAVYGQASSDGRNIFVVPNPGFSIQATTPISGNAEPTLSRAFNELMAIDIEREGAFKWEVGGESGLEEPKLAKTFFLGAPLPLDDELFSVCQQGTEIRVVALDAETGRLKWHQQIGTTETSAIQLLADRYRRLAGVTPSFADGILVCATGNGALVAINISTRSLLWGYQYMTPGRKAVHPSSFSPSSFSDPLDGLWRDSAIVIADGKVLFTPVDAQDLVCVDLQSGFPAWNSPTGLTAKTDRNDSMFLACVENGLAILVGETSVRAISVKTGQPVWEQLTSEFGKPSGRGYANRGDYYFPTTQGKLLQVNLASGEITKTVDTDGVLGNLICYRGDVISHGVDRLACFPQDEPKRKLVANAELTGQMTPELMAIKAQLLMQDGQFRDAVGAIRQAYLQQPSAAYENLLLDWLIRLVEEDFDFGIELAIQHEQQLLAKRQLKYRSAKINGMIHNNHADAAVEELFRMLDPIWQITDVQDLDFLEVSTTKHDRDLLDDNQDPRQNVNEQEKLSIRLDRWIGTRIQRLHERGTADLKSLIETKIDEIAKANDETPPLDRHDRLRVFPMDLIPAQARLKLARDLIGEGNSLRAIQVLEGLSDSNDRQSAASATGIAAREFLKRKMLQSAMAAIEKLDTEFAGVGNGEVQGVARIAENLRDQLKQARDEVGEPASWIRGLVRVTTTRKTSEIANRLFSSPVELIEYDAPEYADYQYRFFGQTGEFEVLDSNGKSVFRFMARVNAAPVYSGYSNYVFGRIAIKDHLALVDIATEVFAFDLQKLQQGLDPVLWNLSKQGDRDPTISSGASMWREVRTTATPRRSVNRIFVSAPGFNGICYLDHTQLVCLDPLTGEKFWQRTNLPRNCLLMGDSTHVIVFDPQSKEVLVIETADGRLAASTKLPEQAGTLWQAKGTRFLVSALHQKLVPSEQDPNLEKQKSDKDQHDTRSMTEKVMGLYDLLEGEFIWKTEYPVETLACRVGRDRIGVLAPEKDLEFINVHTGEVEIRTSLDFDPAERAKINGIGVALIQGNYLMHFKRGDSANRVSLDSQNVRIRPLSFSDRLWMGCLMYVDSTTGKNLWDQRVQFDNFQLGPSQPLNTPVYLLARNVIKTSDSSLGMAYVQFVAIEMKTGRLLANHLHPNNGTIRPPFRIACDSQTQRLTIQNSSHQISLDFIQNLDSPPKPVAHLTNLNSIPDVTVPLKKSMVDTRMIAAEREKSLEKAIAAQKLLPQKRAEEKRLLEAERAGSGDK